MQLYQYQYYSTGLLSSHDPFYEQQRHLGTKKKKIKDEKKIKGKGRRDDASAKTHKIFHVFVVGFV